MLSAEKVALIAKWLLRDCSVQARSERLMSSHVLKKSEYACSKETKDASETAENVKGVKGGVSKSRDPDLSFGG